MEKLSWRQKFSKIMDKIDYTVKMICMLGIGVMTVSILVMVFGRYVFNYVPRGIEQLSILCMVWFSMISISLSIRDDTFIKMEIVDAFLPKHLVKYFQVFSCLMNIYFAVCMIIYGHDLFLLTSRTKMGGLRISEGFLYASVPIGGITMLVASIALILETIWKTEKERGSVDVD